MNAEDRVWQIVDEVIAEQGDFVPAVLAEKVIARLEESHPRVLRDWLHQHAAQFLTVLITRRERTVRSTARHQVVRRNFATAAAAFDEGDEEPLSHFTVTYAVDAENTRRRVADMTGADHEFVAERYEATGKYDLMMCAFHRQVAKKVGKRTTAEVMDEAEYVRLLKSITK